MHLSGKNALVTGAGVRIGKAIALELARAGSHVAVHCGRSREEAERTATACRDFGVKAQVFQADLSDPGAVKALYPEIEKTLGPLDLLVNSAAVFFDGDLLAGSDSDWDIQFAINLRAPFLLCQAFAAARASRPGGGIVNICDARLHRPGTDHFIYRLTKNGLEELTRMLALQLAPHTRVNAVALGAILPPPGKPQAHLDAIAQTRVPLQRSGSAEMVARNVRHLLEEDFITGTILPLDGAEFL